MTSRQSILIRPERDLAVSKRSMRCSARPVRQMPSSACPLKGATPFAVFPTRHRNPGHIPPAHRSLPVPSTPEEDSAHVRDPDPVQRQQPSEHDQPHPPTPSFELRFAELRITLQRPPYRLAGALMTVAGAVSVWLTG